MGAAAGDERFLSVTCTDPDTDNQTLQTENTIETLKTENTVAIVKNKPPKID